MITKYCCICGKPVPCSSEYETGWGGHEGFACKDHADEEIEDYVFERGPRFCSDCGRQLDTINGHECDEA